MIILFYKNYFKKLLKNFIFVKIILLIAKSMLKQIIKFSKFITKQKYNCPAKNKRNKQAKNQF